MLSDEARQARNAYQREYYKKNRDRERKRQEEYWERVAKRQGEKGE